MKKKIALALAAASLMSMIPTPAAAKAYPHQFCVSSYGGAAAYLAQLMGPLFGMGAVENEACFY